MRKLNSEKNWKNVEEGKSFYPLSAFRNKLILVTYTVLLVMAICAILFGWLLLFFGQTDPGDEFLYFLRYGGPSVLVIYLFIITMLFPIIALMADYYTNVMKFTIDETEVIVKKGLINKQVKHIPFRTIANVSSRYGPYDRLLGLGTVEIETAGKSGQQTGPEAKIEGIPNFNAVGDYILTKLRQFRTQYATTTEVAAEAPQLPPLPLAEQDFHRQMLTEIREIKERLSK
ncbi:MAG: PH domain-containing protein [Candidatus Hodarchaeales archaeon]